MFANLNAFFNQLQQRFLLSKLGMQWQQLSKRDQWLLNFLLVFVALFLVYSLFWQPIQTRHSQAVQQHSAAQEEWNWLNAQVVHWQNSIYAKQSSEQTPKNRFKDDTELMSFLNQNLATFKIQQSLKEMKNTNSGVKISLKSVGAVRFFKWLEVLDAQAVELINLQLQRQDAGKIDVEMLIQRN